ncbi:MAG: hypothetical protein ABL898_15865 [Hyphomicrobiaceae bacterium]|nr:hypothetical protein [Hyphomicrobiaceae bacterium]
MSHRAIVTAKTAIAATITAVLLALAPVPATAQTTPGTNPQGRDCKTILTCNFTRGAAVRGCLSSYSCRTCDLVPTRNRIGNAPGSTRQFSCNWGG